jgi:hypothetical protein
LAAQFAHGVANTSDWCGLTEVRPVPGPRSSSLLGKGRK